MNSSDNVTIEFSDDEDKVVCCQHCLSLKIIIIPGTISSYCGFCGNTDLLEVPILEWEEFFLEDTGASFLPGKEQEIQSRIHKRKTKSEDE